LTEERTFREFFGTTKVVVAKLWDLLSQWQMIPEDGTTNHIMWALFFMREYPKEAVTCSTVGGLGGAIDPKTLRKYIWPFIRAIAGLQSEVVSFFACFVFLQYPMSRLTQFVLDCFREQEKERQQQRLPYEHRWHRLPHPSAWPGSKGQPFFLAQVCKEMHSSVRAWCDILQGILVWIEGPYPGGKYTDINIF
jgi:hypothetical protein